MSEPRSVSIFSLAFAHVVIPSMCESASSVQRMLDTGIDVSTNVYLTTFRHRYLKNCCVSCGDASTESLERERKLYG